MGPEVGGGGEFVGPQTLSGTHKLKAARASIISISRVRGGGQGGWHGFRAGSREEFVGPETPRFRDPQTQGPQHEHICPRNVQAAFCQMFMHLAECILALTRPPKWPNCILPDVVSLWQNAFWPFG